jgi:hypothetical protein
MLLASPPRVKRYLLVALTTVACAGNTTQTGTPTTAQPIGKPARPGASFPGFDKRDFPSLREMQIWWDTSPFEWVGYYLPSPCFAGAAWTGNREALTRQGWGLAPIYVGLQAPRTSATVSDSVAASDTSRAAAQTIRCSQNSLSASQGTVDGDDAANVALADGFAEGTSIFLDVERTEPSPAALDEYVRAWSARVLARGLTPGIYAHRLNADALWSTMRAAYASAGDARQPPLWISSSQGFDLSKLPAESGFPNASVWQNPSDASVTYGGVTFRIDSNVSRTRDPSR